MRIFDGIGDLKRRALRAVGVASERFSEDGLRVLRAARFVATLGFEPAADVVDQMHALRDRLRIISAERIRDELSKLLLASTHSGPSSKG